MRRDVAARAGALSLLAAATALVVVADAKHVHGAHGAHHALEAIHKRHRHNREVERANNESLEKRGGSCSFPLDLGLIAVTPALGNGGWAFAPDKSCTAGNYCPYACPPGQVSMQWDPDATSYSYPKSRNGGLLCGENGQLTKPFPDKPYCQSTAQNIGVQNTCGSVVTFCQTVLPGDEDMLIPTVVTDSASLAVPDPGYWANTAAHYYINPPGVGAAEGCVWGSKSQPVGNWAAYVAGANSDASGQTFIKLGWNPVYLEPDTPFKDQMPDWGVKIECPDGSCGGLPCAIDPSKNKVNEMTGSGTGGAGGGSFCVVTVPKGSKANFVVFKAGQGDAKIGGQFYQTPTAPTTASTTSVVQATTNTTTSSPTLPTSYASTNITTSSDTKSTGQGYYALFNTTSPNLAANTGAANIPSGTAIPSTNSKNGASSLKTSTTVLLLVLGAMLS